MDTIPITAERISRSASIVLKGNIETVFPLFGAFEERKWVEGWNPQLIYPETETIQEGTSFKTPGRGNGESEFIWIVVKYEPDNFLVQYLVFTNNRFWTIEVKCDAIDFKKTSAKITYTFTGLNETGNRINKEAMEKMYRNELKDWEEAINHYLKNETKSLSH